MSRVLIIDDEEFSAETIKIILEDAGEAKADYSTSYEEARELVKQSIKSNKPYEIFLIDQRMGPGKDGIEAMQELRAISPDSDAIIFTGREDIENGVRAYEAGAFRYLSKPFENRELLFLLKSLKQWRKEQQEHGWQKLFTSMMEDALRKSSFSEVGEIVVKYALKLGFSRAHLFWVPTQEDANHDNHMIGIACAGRGCIPQFVDASAEIKLYPLKQWFDLNRAIKAHEAIFFESGEAKDVQLTAKALGYRWPKGEIVFLPLWGSNRLLGELMLDHGQREKILSKQEFSLLNLFARQVAIILENASLISREQRTVQETVTISQIGRQVTGRAAEETNLSELLKEVHEQISFLMDVSNFSVVLLDPETGRLEIGLWYENGILQNPLLRPNNIEIESYLMSYEGGFFWQKDVAKHLEENNINLEGRKIPTSCIGVQMRVGRKTIGGIVAKSYVSGFKFTHRDYVLLSAVASQISGAIQLFLIYEFEKRDAERLNVLRRASIDLLRIAQKNEKDLWLTVLTTATSYFGINFDHALLMFLDEFGTNLNGEISIGLSPLSKPLKDKNYTYDDFLVDLEKHNLINIDPSELTENISVTLSKDSNLVYQVIQYGHRIVVSGNETTSQLPVEVLELGISKCAILPLFGAEHVFGLVIVDNETSGMPLDDRGLNWLQTLLNQAALVWTYIKFASKIDLAPSRKLRVFLCHSKLDKERVRNIYETLSLQKGIEMDPWLDTEKLLPGDNWMMKIEEAVTDSDVVIVCLSDKSLTKQGFIHKEISLALDTADLKPEGTVFIIPLRLEECSVPKRLSKWQWFDYFENSQDDFNKLMRALRERAKSLD